MSTAVQQPSTSGTNAADAAVTQASRGCEGTGVDDQFWGDLRSAKPCAASHLQTMKDLTLKEDTSGLRNNTQAQQAEQVGHSTHGEQLHAEPGFQGLGEAQRPNFF